MSVSVLSYPGGRLAVTCQVMPDDPDYARWAELAEDAGPEPGVDYEAVARAYADAWTAKERAGSPVSEAEIAAAAEALAGGDWHVCESEDGWEACQIPDGGIEMARKHDEGNFGWKATEGAKSKKWVCRHQGVLHYSTAKATPGRLPKSGRSTKKYDESEAAKKGEKQAETKESAKEEAAPEKTPVTKGSSPIPQFHGYDTAAADEEASIADRLAAASNIDVEALDDIRARAYDYDVAGNEWLRAVEMHHGQYAGHEGERANSILQRLANDGDMIRKYLVPGLRKMAADGIEGRGGLDLNVAADWYEANAPGLIAAAAKDVERIGRERSDRSLAWPPGEPNFTGEDALGRKWIDGKLASKAAPEPKGEARPAMLDTAAVAKHAMVAPRTVSKWVDSGVLPGERDPESGNRTVSEPDLSAFFVANNMPVPAGMSHVTPTPPDVFAAKVARAKDAASARNPAAGRGDAVGDNGGAADRSDVPGAGAAEAERGLRQPVGVGGRSVGEPPAEGDAGAAAGRGAAAAAGVQRGDESAAEAHLVEQEDYVGDEYQKLPKPFRDRARRAAMKGKRLPEAVEAEQEIRDRHRAAVEAALAAGKLVPPEVLKDYPDLAPSSEAAPEPQGEPEPKGADAAPPEAAKKVKDLMDRLKETTPERMKEVLSGLDSLSGSQLETLARELGSTQRGRKTRKEWTDVIKRHVEGVRTLILRSGEDFTGIPDAPFGRTLSLEDGEAFALSCAEEWSRLGVSDEEVSAAADLLQDGPWHVFEGEDGAWLALEVGDEDEGFELAQRHDKGNFGWKPMPAGGSKKWVCRVAPGPGGLRYSSAKTMPKAPPGEGRNTKAPPTPKPKAGEKAPAPATEATEAAKKVKDVFARIGKDARGEEVDSALAGLDGLTRNQLDALAKEMGSKHQSVLDKRRLKEVLVGLVRGLYTTVGRSEVDDAGAKEYETYGPQGPPSAEKAPEAKEQPPAKEEKPATTEKPPEKEAKAAPDLPPEQRRLLGLMRKLDTDADRGATIDLTQLRRESGMGKEEFDKQIIDLATREMLDLHRHVEPELRTPEQEEQMVSDGRGNVYLGAAKSMHKGATPWPDLTDKGPTSPPAGKPKAEEKPPKGAPVKEPPHRHTQAHDALREFLGEDFDNLDLSDPKALHEALRAKLGGGEKSQPKAEAKTEEKPAAKEAPKGPPAPKSNWSLLGDSEGATTRALKDLVGDKMGHLAAAAGGGENLSVGSGGGARSVNVFGPDRKRLLSLRRDSAGGPLIATLESGSVADLDEGRIGALRALGATTVHDDRGGRRELKAEPKGPPSAAPKQDAAPAATEKQAPPAAEPPAPKGTPKESPATKDAGGDLKAIYEASSHPDLSGDDLRGAVRHLFAGLSDGEAQKAAKEMGFAIRGKAAKIAKEVEDLIITRKGTWQRAHSTQEDRQGAPKLIGPHVTAALPRAKDVIARAGGAAKEERPPAPAAQGSPPAATEKHPAEKIAADVKALQEYGARRFYGGMSPTEREASAHMADVNARLDALGLERISPADLKAIVKAAGIYAPGRSKADLIQAVRRHILVVPESVAGSST